MVTLMNSFENWAQSDCKLLVQTVWCSFPLFLLRNVSYLGCVCLSEWTKAKPELYPYNTTCSYHNNFEKGKYFKVSTLLSYLNVNKSIHLFLKELEVSLDIWSTSWFSKLNSKLNKMATKAVANYRHIH